MPDKKEAQLAERPPSRVSVEKAMAAKMTARPPEAALPKQERKPLPQDEKPHPAAPPERALPILAPKKRGKAIPLLVEANRDDYRDAFYGAPGFLFYFLYISLQKTDKNQ